MTSDNGRARPGDQVIATEPAGTDPTEQRKQVEHRMRILLAGFLDLLGQEYRRSGKLHSAVRGKALSEQMLNQLVKELRPRLRQTLTHLLEGQSEKEIALDLKISRHTVHAYVKEIYLHFDVTTRPELLALFVIPSRLLGGRLANPPI